MIRLLHLSDIHFSRPVGNSLLDIDAAVRTDLLNDLRALDGEITPIDAILVVGDVAATGAVQEYDRANQFLDETANLVCCDRASVVCVPGNHDVDWTKQKPLHDGLRRLLRTAEPRRVGSELLRVLRDDDAATILHEPFANYNQFATPLGCAVRADTPIWGAKDLDMDGYPVRLRGVNSAITCDGTESDQRMDERLILGDVQLAQLTEDVETVSILLCHHPVNWLRDGDIVDQWLARPHLLLTGHEHELGIVERADGRSATIAAGAVTPERTETGWAPAYNVIELSQEGDSLLVDVRVRCYGKGRTGFGPDERFDDPHRLRLPLSRRTRPPEEVEAPAEPASPEPLQSEEHGLIYRALTAAPDAREQAARKLGLLGPTDRIDDLTAERDLVDGARASGKLRELVEAIHDV